MRNFFFRVVGAATLDANVYEDVEADTNATAQAVAVILLASLAAGFGANGWNTTARSTLTYSAVVAVLALLAWASWALVTFEIGGHILPGTASLASPALHPKTPGRAWGTPENPR